MANKRDGQASSTCERIWNAIRPGRVFRPIAPASRRKPQPHPRTSGNPRMAVAGSGNDDQVAIVKQAKIAPATGSERTKPEGEHVENRFTDYIERARAKLRTVSRIGTGGEKEKRDSNKKSDEHFTNFIDKAKARLRRTTSSIGGGKDVTSHK